MNAQKNYCLRCYIEGRLTEIPSGQIGCDNCKTAVDAESERNERLLGDLNTTAEKIEFLLRELRKTKKVLPGGKMRTIYDPGPARGRSSKNIDRILRRGREQQARAAAVGADLSVLPPDNPIRKRVEAQWERRIKYGIRVPGHSIRGVAGRASTSKRRQSLRDRARALHREQPYLTEQQIAEQIGRTERTVRRYLTGK